MACGERLIESKVVALGVAGGVAAQPSGQLDHHIGERAILEVGVDLRDGRVA